jgi:hypothetical protein
MGIAFARLIRHYAKGIGAALYHLGYHIFNNKLVGFTMINEERLINKFFTCTTQNWQALA